MNLKLVTAVAAVAVLGLAGCSSDDDGDDAASATPSAEASEEATEDGDSIADIASGNPDFSTLVAAADAAGLVETLDTGGPFTVFAPPNEAFDALPEGTVDQLLLPANQAQLTSILTYHVVAGEVTSDEITAGDVPTVEGQSVTITTDDGAVMVNEATVTTPDIEASNGVIHVIDQVLLPPGFDLTTLATE